MTQFLKHFHLKVLKLVENCLKGMLAFQNFIGTSESLALVGL